MISHLAEYDLWDEEREAIMLGLNGTNDEKVIWFDFLLKGNLYSIKLKFAYDDEEGPDMIHLGIETSHQLREKLESVNLFQSMFRELIE